MGDAPRYSRRDNGLVASAYAAVGDVDPRVGEHLLDVLAQEGIAAYLRPSSDLHPITRSTTLPNRPTDRLYVDLEHLATARAHVAKLASEEREFEPRAGEAKTEQARTAATTAVDPDADDATANAGEGTHGAARPGEPSAADVDRAFAEIVAGFGQPAGVEPRRTTRDAQVARAEPEPEPERSLLDGLDTFGADLPDDDAEPFVPPEPPPVPRPSPSTVLAVIGVVGGLIVFLKPSLLSFVSEGTSMLLGFTAIICGFGTLVWRLRPGNDDDEADPDQGARV